MGPIIRVFDLISKEQQIDLNSLLERKLLFPPIITGLFAAIRTGLWKKVGKLPVANFTHPMFILSRWNDRTGEVLYWSLWDGINFIDMGKYLPEEYKDLEFLTV